MGLFDNYSSEEFLCYLDILEYLQKLNKLYNTPIISADYDEKQLVEFAKGIDVLNTYFGDKLAENELNELTNKVFLVFLFAKVIKKYCWRSKSTYSQ